MTTPTAAMNKEHPLLFAQQFIPKLLSGEKTETRRPLKPQPEGGDILRPAVSKETGEIWEYCNGPTGIFCPCKVGDTIWVRETWMPLWDSGAGFYTCVCPTGREGTPDKIKYRDDGEKPLNFGANWRPSIHMPRKFARIFLKVTDVRVERLWSLEELDAIAEGFAGQFAPAYVSAGEIVGPDGVLPTQEFMEAWDKIYPIAKWATNPWVSVTQFSLVKP